MSSKTVSVIIPSYNEEQNVRQAITTAAQVLEKNTDDYEILAFNDGSRDKTGAILEELAKSNPHIKVIHNSPNKGYGFITREGFRLATKEYISWFSGDNSVEGESFARIIKSIGEADIVVAYMENAQVRSFMRSAVTGSYTILMNVLFGLHIKYYNGPSVYPVKVVRQVKIAGNQYDLFAELLIRSIKMGHSYKEVPFKHKADNDGKSKAFSWRNALSTMKMFCVLINDIYFRRQPAG